ncbi:MAG: DMT family transporter [Marinosulfonomonas sp.]|nr:DMT family transporter [Marinosulfonomonas sp.]
MERKDHIDLPGATMLILFAVLLGINQVTIKVTNEGLQPTFFAAVRSIGSALCVALWVYARGKRFDFPSGTIRYGILVGVIFSIQFTGLFAALDMTTVTRVSVILYSMPIWLAIGAHFLLPGERIHRAKAIGLIIAFSGLAWAIIDRGAGVVGQASLIGDLAALVGALGWAAITLIMRGTPLREVSPETQNFWQMAVSGPLLLLAAPFVGPLIRDLQPLHLWLLAFQIVVITFAAFVFWFWLLTIYPASGVASFSFLSPIFGILLGWLLLGEEIGASILIAGAMVAVGLVLINRPKPDG